MRPLKCWAWKPWCWWSGCKPVIGSANYYGEQKPCMCCAHCHKHMGWIR